MTQKQSYLPTSAFLDLGLKLDFLNQKGDNNKMTGYDRKKR